MPALPYKHHKAWGALPKGRGRLLTAGLLASNLALLFRCYTSSGRCDASAAASPPADAAAATIAGLRAQVAALMKLRVDYGRMHCKLHGIGPTGGYCVKSMVQEVGSNHFVDDGVCARMAEIFARSSVLDLGCGLGWYGECLDKADKGIRWTGLDGSEGIEKATGGAVKFADLALPLHNLEPRGYDWVMSLEVGEHIPAEYEDVFLDNLVRHAQSGIVLSWAVEGQGGHHHVNNHNNHYVIDKMAAKGFEYDQDATDSLRQAAELPWFRDSIMVFLPRRNREEGGMTAS